MNIATVYTRASQGMRSPLVKVEVHLSQGMPGFNMVGLPETAVRESKDRIRSALLSNKFDFPFKRITVNLAPADVPKEGSRFDLPIALGILIASEQLIVDDIERYEFAGELGLTGELRQVHGALPFALQTKQAARILVVPFDNQQEVSLANNETYAPKHLLDICAHLNKTCRLAPVIVNPLTTESNDSMDLSDIKGQTQAKRAMIIAAAGGHNMLFSGPPGTGKTMLAHRLLTLLPVLSEHEMQEVVAIASITGRLDLTKNWSQRPFRSPHHTASSAALIGGGNPPRPGEISLAHHGVLFLDELPEFQRNVLEALREPLESGSVTISRAARQAEYPANFMLVAAMNPCPCGFSGDKDNECRCTPDRIGRYQNKLSGPLLDRIDIHLNVPRIQHDKVGQTETIKSHDILPKIIKARAIQMNRQGCLNARLSGQAQEAQCQLSREDRDFFNKTCEKFRLSIRVYHKLLKIARTIADLNQLESISQHHLSEALSYRRIEQAFSL
jgi:magnesium chelatase family protein